MTKDLATTTAPQLTTAPAYGELLRPTNLREAMDLSEILAASDLVPKDYKGKPGNVVVAIQMGAEVGLAPMAAIQSIAVINGRPGLWGDALLAVVQAHPEFVDCVEEKIPDGRRCTCIRKGRKPVVQEFTIENAKTAKLWNKDGPWRTYPDRMLKMRARGFAIRDLWADVIRGLSSAEEQRDIVDARAVESRTVETSEKPKTAPKAEPKSDSGPKANPLVFDPRADWPGRTRWGGRLLTEAPEEDLREYLALVIEVANKVTNRRALAHLEDHIKAIEHAIQNPKPPPSSDEPSSDDEPAQDDEPRNDRSGSGAEPAGFFSKRIAWDGAELWEGKSLNEATLDTLTAYSEAVQAAIKDPAQESYRTANVDHLELVDMAVGAKEPK